MNIYDRYIKNYRDVGVWTIMVKDYENRLREAENPEAKERCDEIKRAIRRFYKKVCTPKNWRVVKDYGIDGAVLLLTLPEGIGSLDEAVRYMEENEVMEYEPSPYDCTGQQFTSWFKCFVRNGRWMAYHRISVDV